MLKNCYNRLMAHGSWLMAHGSWLMAHGSWLMAYFIPCAVLVALTVLFDFIFLPITYPHTVGYVSLRGYLTVFAGYILSSASVTGLLTALRVVPFVGNYLQWLAWIILSVPFRLYYFIMKAAPSVQDLFSLFNVNVEMSLDTILALFSLKAVISALIPTFIVAIIFIFLNYKKIRLINLKPKSFKFSIVVFIIGIAVTGLYFKYPRGSAIPLDSMSASINIIRSFNDNFKYMRMVRKPFTSEKILTKIPQNNVVLIVDESMRGDYISINNPGLGTTEVLEKYLKKYPENLYNYGVAMSGATCTFMSRIMLITGVNHIPDTELRTFINPTIFDVANANGYKTICANLQGDFPDMIFKESDVSRIDEVYLNDDKFNFGLEKADFNGAKYLNKRLKEEKGLFIYLNKRGLHIPYEENYPGDRPENQKFMPKMEKGEWYTVDKRQKVINSYKNGVSYNLNGFFENLFGENPLDLKDCTIIWTSDHGQSFMEYGQLGSHCSNYFEQSLVPFLLFSTDSWVLEHLKRPDKDIKCTLSHLNIYPTLQSILCRDLNHSSGEYYSIVSNKDFKNPPLGFLGRGHIISAMPEVSEKIDEAGKMILPVEKYLY